MSYIRLRRPSPALILSAVALFIALGGVAYAVPASSSTTVSAPTVVRANFSVPSSASTIQPVSKYAKCPKGSYATGGGVGGHQNVYVMEDGPVDSSGSFSHTATGTYPVQWYVTVTNDNTFTVIESVWVVCQHYG